MAGLRRYDLIARRYDTVSLERWLYAAPRARALDLLGAHPGDTVLDLGCGTGLNFPRLIAMVGPGGQVIGVDASAGMLAAARQRIRAAGWPNVTLIRGDLTDLPALVCTVGRGDARIDAITATYVLNLLADDEPAWRALLTLAADSPVRVALADIGPPDTAPRWQRPGWWLLARLGGVRPGESWRALARHADNVTMETSHGGHVRVAAGRLRRPTLNTSETAGAEAEMTKPAAQFANPRFAKMYLRISEHAEHRGVAEHRRTLLSGLSGTVCEVGAGNGLNFRYYPSTVTNVLAVEPEPTLRAHAQRAAAAAPVPVQVIDGHADALPVTTDSCDAVVASLVLCSVPDLAGALTEIHRVLHPAGELRYYEHVRSPGRLRGRLQDAITPMWARCGAGCHPNRDTAAAIAAAGFTITALDRFAFRPQAYAPPLTHILGHATAASAAR